MHKDAYIHMESLSHSTYQHWRPNRPADINHMHKVVIAVSQQNLELIESILNDISDPWSSTYGQHLSFEEVVTLTSHPEASAFLESYLESRGVKIVNNSPHGEYITAVARIGTWETILNAKFAHYCPTVGSCDQRELLRAPSYSIPEPWRGKVTAGKGTRISFQVVI